MLEVVTSVLAEVCKTRVYARTMLDELCNGSNIVALRFGHHGIRNVLGVVRWLKSLTLTLRNNVQHSLLHSRF